LPSFPEVEQAICPPSTEVRKQNKSAKTGRKMCFSAIFIISWFPSLSLEEKQ
jgi:hypothetical protein